MSSYSPGGPWPVGVRDLALYTGPGELNAKEHLAARIFYPAAPKPSASTNAPPILWTSCWNYAMGYAHYPFAFEKKWIYQPLKLLVASVVWYLGSSCRIHGYWNAPVAYPVQPQASKDTASSIATTPDGSFSAATVIADSSSGKGTSAAKNDTEGNGSVMTDSQQGGASGFPVLLVSHGLAGQRNTYSNICVEMASQGYVVVAVEHSDGTASAAHLTGPGLTWTPNAIRETPSQAKGRWRWFRGIGERAAYVRRTDYRMRELQTALEILKELNEGRTRKGVTVTGHGDSDTFLKGRLDLARVAVAGHSFGGATVALAASSDPAFKCAVAWDPWWDALPDSCPALEIWSTSSPLLIIGSHVWNTPDPVTGKLKCNGELQEQVLAAAQVTGGGAMLIVPRYSTHSSFDDILLNFGSSRIVQTIMTTLLGNKAEKQLPAARAHEINCRSLLHFLRTHLPAPSSVSGPAPLAASSIPLVTETRPMAGLAEAAAAARDAAAAKAKGAVGGVQPGEPKPLVPGCDQAYREILGDDLEKLVLASLNK